MKILCDVIVQLSSNNICAIKSTLSLEKKCPQLNKTKMPRNQDFISDRMEEIKPWEKSGSV